VRQRAQAIGSDLIDQLYSIDSNNYFDAMGTPGKRGGQQEAQFAAFSLQAAHAAQVSGRPANSLELQCKAQAKVDTMAAAKCVLSCLQVSLRSFLKVMPAEEVEAARQQAAVSAF